MKPISPGQYVLQTFVFPLVALIPLAGLWAFVTPTDSFLPWAYLAGAGFLFLVVSVRALRLIYAYRKETSNLTRFLHFLCWLPILGAGLIGLQGYVISWLEYQSDWTAISISGAFVLLDMGVLLYGVVFFLYPQGFFLHEWFFAPPIRYPHQHREKL